MHLSPTCMFISTFISSLYFQKIGSSFVRWHCIVNSVLHRIFHQQLRIKDDQKLPFLPSHPHKDYLVQEYIIKLLRPLCELMM